MQLLAICGSPCKGNSSNALKRIGDAFPGIDFEILHLIELDKKVMKADYAYYKDKGDYYYETNIPFYKKIINQFNGKPY